MAEDEGTISVEVRDHILLMGFNRPQKYNGYTPKMAKELLAAFTRLDEDDELRCGVIFGHGDHFTAGLDLPKWTGRMESGGTKKGNRDMLDPLAVQETKASSRRYIVEGFDAAVAAFGSTQKKLLASEDAREGVQSFIERRTAVFKGR